MTKEEAHIAALRHLVDLLVGHTHEGVEYARVVNLLPEGDEHNIQEELAREFRDRAARAERRLNRAS